MECNASNIVIFSLIMVIIMIIIIFIVLRQKSNKDEVENYSLVPNSFDRKEKNVIYNELKNYSTNFMKEQKCLLCQRADKDDSTYKDTMCSRFKSIDNAMQKNDDPNLKDNGNISFNYVNYLNDSERTELYNRCNSDKAITDPNKACRATCGVLGSDGAAKKCLEVQKKMLTEYIIKIPQIAFDMLIKNKDLEVPSFGYDLLKSYINSYQRPCPDNFCNNNADPIKCKIFCNSNYSRHEEYYNKSVDDLRQLFSTDRMNYLKIHSAYFPNVTDLSDQYISDELKKLLDNKDRQKSLQIACEEAFYRPNQLTEPNIIMNPLDYVNYKTNNDYNDNAKNKNKMYTKLPSNHFYI